MRQRDPAKAVEVLDLLLEFFADGALWLQREFHHPDGSRCLVSALTHVRRKHGITGDGTGFYLLEMIPQRASNLIEFNDTCRDFGEVRAMPHARSGRSPAARWGWRPQMPRPR